jgi:uncharacterized membrane protein
MDVIVRIFHVLVHVYPQHPMSVHFPIALTGAALFFILLALWRRNEILEKVAFANLALAAASTIVAAALGIYDNIVSYDGKAPTHTAKIVLACMLFAVTSATVVIRWKQKIPFRDKTRKALYAAAYFVSFALAAVLGFLGGVILYGF